MRQTRYASWFPRAAERYVKAHEVLPTSCTSCRAYVSPVDRIMRKEVEFPDGKKRKRLGVSDHCVDCRLKRKPSNEQVNGKPWGTFDYMAWAESVLYPDIPYLKMTLDERQHSYWLARVRWAQDGLYGVLMHANQKNDAELRREERRRLKALRLTLARRGCAVQFPPYTDWLDADDYADDHGRDAGALEGGRDDADFDGDLEGEEAA